MYRGEKRDDRERALRMTHTNLHVSHRQETEPRSVETVMSNEPTVRPDIVYLERMVETYCALRVRECSGETLDRTELEWKDKSFAALTMVAAEALLFDNSHDAKEVSNAIAPCKPFWPLS